MDFTFDAKTEDYRKRLLAFMDEYVYPAEAGYEDCVSRGVDHVLVSPHYFCAAANIEDDELSDHPRIAVDIVPSR